MLLVTGATGFLGKRLCEMLEENGHAVLKTGSKQGNIATPQYFDAFENEQVDHIFHLAAKTFVPESWKDPFPYFETNLLGTLQVLEFARKKKAPVTCVSSYMYGNAGDDPIPESAAIQPGNPYAVSKKMGEDLCRFYATCYGIRIVIVRPFNIYGPGQPNHFLLPSIIDQVKRGDKVMVKCLEPKRDYVFIDDVARLLIATMQPQAAGVYNAGSGSSWSVQEVIDMVMEASGKNVIIESQEEIRPNEIMNTIADIGKAKRELGWEPEIQLSEGIRRMIEQPG